MPLQIVWQMRVFVADYGNFVADYGDFWRILTLVSILFREVKQVVSRAETVCYIKVTTRFTA